MSTQGENRQDARALRNDGEGWRVDRYREGRHFGVWDPAGELVCVCVYRKGAEAVRRRLGRQLSLGLPAATR